MEQNRKIYMFSVQIVINDRGDGKPYHVSADKWFSSADEATNYALEHILLKDPYNRYQWELKKNPYCDEADNRWESEYGCVYVSKFEVG